MGPSEITTSPPAVPEGTVTEVSTGSELVAVVPVLTVPPLASTTPLVISATGVGVGVGVDVGVGVSVGVTVGVGVTCGGSSVKWKRPIRGLPTKGEPLISAMGS